MIIELIRAGVEQGLLLSIVAFGLMIPFRMLNFPDLTAEGAYPLGGAVCAKLIIMGGPCFVATFCGLLSSGLMSVATSQIALRMRVNSLLAGIILNTMAYSVILRIMGKKPSITLLPDMGEYIGHIFFLSFIVAVCIVPFLCFLYTDFGLRFRAVGLNPEFASRHNISIRKNTAFGLFFSGAMFGLAGSLVVQMQKFMYIGIGVGIVIHGLASLMIGEEIVGNKGIIRQVVAPIVGSLIYQQAQGIVLLLGLVPSDLKFFTGGIVLLILSLRKRKQQ